MKQETYPDASFFVGKWELEGNYRVARPGTKAPEWICRHKYEPGDVIWKFDERLSHTAYEKGEFDYQTKYAFDPEEKKLSFAIAVANHKFHHYANFRVEIENENEIWLYFINGVRLEPQGYRIAHRLKRI